MQLVYFGYEEYIKLHFQDVEAVNFHP